ncbi:hypothetical protein [Nocardia sp. alder85J]|uniref:hypothetical protein n=1 Tax=Nocardia sp. alder85J TaxID=2862949 RepID=UPI001CD4FCC0|nr:hypothetical protein [Nocardia sp. alder85J]MCX4092313.1 hypothetical protein [Nocardia sp. alder85J]
MSSVVIVVVVIVVVVAALAAAAWPMARRQRLRSRFGPEYDRVVTETGDRRSAEHELAERERRHAEYDLRELTDEERQRYTGQWTEVQERFVDDPEAALQDADRLIAEIMSERGYPAEDFDRQVADLSVRHAEPLEHYRSAHEISTRAGDTEVSTEDRRAAIVNYRELFEDLLNGETRNKKAASS